MEDAVAAAAGPGGWLVNLLAVGVAGAILGLLSLPAVRRSEAWRATVTPLASIIGSGFLVVAPLLGFTVGEWAVAAMAGIVAMAYAVGWAVRYNIAHVEEILEEEGPHEGGAHRGSHRGSHRAIAWLGHLAKLALAAAYVVAIAFYLELLGAFVLRLVGVDSETLQKAIASALLVFIGGLGLLRGLRKLESLEEYSVNAKLAIIGGFIAALALFNLELARADAWRVPRMGAELDLETVRMLLGAFLIVQGFETSRYLRGAYSARTRIRTMRLAQLAAAGVYLAFIALATVLMDSFTTISETGIIDLSGKVALVLPALLMLGAVLSQFSAAVADTIASGGLVEEESGGRIRQHHVYAAAAALALGLIWSTHIFAVIAHASRAFALYYALQCAMASLHALSVKGGRRETARGVAFAGLAAAMLATAVLAIPAETAGE